MIKLAVFDLDGTLAQIGKGMEYEDIELLKSIRSMGVEIALCSGKPAYYLCGFARQLNIPDIILIGENGAVMQFGVELPPKNYHVYDCGSSVRNKLITIKNDIENILNDKVWFQPNVVGVTPFPMNLESFDVIQKYIDDNPTLFEGIEIFKHSDCYDFIPKGFNKCDGLKMLSSITSISSDEMIVVGDGCNDYPMFEYVSHSVGVNVKDEEVVSINFKDINSALKYIITILGE